MDAALQNPGHNGGIFLLLALLRYRRQIGRRPRRFYVRPWIRPRQCEQYGHYHRLMRGENDIAYDAFLFHMKSFFFIEKHFI